MRDKFCDEDFLDVIQFIQNNIKFTDDWKQNICEVEKIKFYFEKKGIQPREGYIRRILQECVFLKNILNQIIYKCPNIVMNFNEYSNDSVFHSFLDIYCMMYFDEVCDVINVDISEEDVDSEYYTDVFKNYIMKINQPLLSSDEEKILLFKMKNGDEEAKKILIERNLRLVVFIAKRHFLFIGEKMSLIDLIQEGNIGLMKALSMYDLSYGVKFSSYAFYWISSSISRAIEKYSRLVRIPVNVIYKITKYRKECQRLENELFREPTIDEIASNLGISIEEAGALYHLLYDTISLSFESEDDMDDVGIALENKLSDASVNVEESAISSVVHDEVLQLFKECELTSREIDILLLRYGFYDDVIYTYEEISKKYSVSKQAIQAAEVKALNKIRCNKKVDDFAIYMRNSKKCLTRVRSHREKLRKLKNKRFYYWDMDSE